MVCKNVKDIVEGYETTISVIIALCTDKACTLDYIQQYLEKQRITITEDNLYILMSQIKEMMLFSKENSYEIGDAVTYWSYWVFGLIYGGEKIGNEIVHVEYKPFYLYNNKRFTDDAFRQYVFPKLEFEEIRRVTINNGQELQKALICLNIDKNKWTNYVFVNDKGKVRCKGWNPLAIGCVYTQDLGNFVKRTPVSGGSGT